MTAGTINKYPSICSFFSLLFDIRFPPIIVPHPRVHFPLWGRISDRRSRSEILPGTVHANAVYSSASAWAFPHAPKYRFLGKKTPSHHNSFIVHAMESFICYLFFRLFIFDGVDLRLCICHRCIHILLACEHFLLRGIDRSGDFRPIRRRASGLCSRHHFCKD